MLTISDLKSFYFVSTFTDMRCKGPCLLEIIHRCFGRDPYNEYVYLFMSKDRNKLRMIHFEDHAYYLHEKSFTDFTT